MKLRMDQTLSDGTGTYHAGKEYQFEPKRAKELIAARVATQVDEKAVQEKRETAQPASSAAPASDSKPNPPAKKPAGKKGRKK